jgi:hypothetical protein
MPTVEAVKGRAFVLAAKDGCQTLFLVFYDLLSPTSATRTVLLFAQVISRVGWFDRRW